MTGTRHAIGHRAVPIAPQRRPAFTIVELMVVMTIMGMLMSMLFPAVQVAREGARKTVCEGNLRNLGQAIFAFMARDSERQMFPTGGWGSRWVGNPNLSGSNQSGGWAFQILPYMEQAGVYNMGLGNTVDPTGFNVAKLSVVMPLFICPSRRIPQLFPFISSGRNVPSPASFSFADTDLVERVSRGDYAINAGDQPLCYAVGGATATEDLGPPTLAQGIDDTWWNNTSNTKLYERRPGTPPAYNPNSIINYEPSGVSFRRGNIVRSGSLLNAERLEGVNVSMVDGPKGDGRAYVYLLGEKNLDVLRYNTGADEGDDDALYSGYGNDNYRTAYAPPLRDVQESFDLQSDISRRCRFGSAHPYGAHFVFCDGRIKMVSFFVHPLVHAKLANRSDNLLTSVVPAVSPSPGLPFAGVYWPPRAAETAFPVPNPEDKEF